MIGGLAARFENLDWPAASLGNRSEHRDEIVAADQARATAAYQDACRERARSGRTGSGCDNREVPSPGRPGAASAWAGQGSPYRMFRPAAAKPLKSLESV